MGRCGVSTSTLPAMPRSRADGSVPTRAEKGKARAVWNRLLKRYPEIGTALDYESPWQLLVVTVLSAQTTDENVNKAAPALFAAYPSPEALAGAPLSHVEELVFSTGFYRQKASAIVSLAQDLTEKFDGEVPDDLDQLVTLKGVGRKTASVVLAEAFGKPAIAVDTHGRRTTNRLGEDRDGSQGAVSAGAVGGDLDAVHPIRSRHVRCPKTALQRMRDDQALRIRRQEPLVAWNHRWRLRRAVADAENVRAMPTAFPDCSTHGD